ncbi:MAG: aconitate hydratase AcnA [Alphaproteobacteria bacterium]|nr:aconitate hydratase AcnA [Alphaproteobacteria bacterium]
MAQQNIDNIFKSTLVSGGKNYTIIDLNLIAKELGVNLKTLPYSLRILLENAVRGGASMESLKPFTNWGKSSFVSLELDFYPARVLMQDFTGVPAVVDLAAMRDAMHKLGGDPEKINPLIPVDVVVDHSVMVMHSGTEDAHDKNAKFEFEQNFERYKLFKWAQNSFKNFKVVPPGAGICHQVNLEYIAKVVWTDEKDGELMAYPDTLVGTDSHTTMINGLGVLAWGVGGIEAEAAMLGQPLPMLIPDVIGVELKGMLPSGVTATDLVLTITETLRKKGVVGKFVEYFGSGLANLPLAHRATIGNMSPEYGSTCGFFPVDNHTIEYLNLTSRDSSLITLVNDYCKHQKLFLDHEEKISYTDKIEIDLSAIEPSMAGPKRPQDRVVLPNIRSSIETEIDAYEPMHENRTKRFADSSGADLAHGDVVIAAITSCTNTSNPYVLIGAGLLAKKAVELGLETKPWVKASLAPGSLVVTEYLNKAGLTPYLDKLKFNLVGYGCTTCIGNSGPLAPEIEKLINDNKLLVASVLSGNRNFEGRIHPLVRANYLASPPLVVAFALAGTTKIDLTKDPIGKSVNGKDVFLKDLWPTQKEIDSVVNSTLSKEMYKSIYANVYSGNSYWKDIQVESTKIYNWDDNSTFIKNPPFFENFTISNEKLHDIKDARILALFGDSITTDHISPAGSISKTSPAAKYLNEKGVENKDFNSYGARRGNHEVMMRGTFANIRIKNNMLEGVEGGFTKYIPSGEQMSIYDASMRYISENIPLVIFSGKEYGTGSSRDWAAKGTSLLGVKAVIAQSFERIHRSNLIGMGVLPLIVGPEDVASVAKLKGSEIISILGIKDNMGIMPQLKCVITTNAGEITSFNVTAMIQTESELEYLMHGNILRRVVKELYGY